MESRDNSQGLRNDQQAFDPSEGQRIDDSIALTVKPLPFTPASQPMKEESPRNNFENQQVSAWAKPPPNVQNVPLIFAQSAARMIQEAPLYPPRDPPSRTPEDTQSPTPVDARFPVRQEGAQYLDPYNGPTPPLYIQPSTSEYVQSRRPEGTRFPVFSNGRPIFNRPPLSSIREDGGAEDLREPPQARIATRNSNGRASTSVDWMVPVEDSATCQGNRTGTVGDRLQPTLLKAHAERHKCSIKAKISGWALNFAIFLQVILGSLTTGVAAGATDGKQAAIGTTILGALSTIVASFLARARGSGEPELSATRVRDLEHFIREVDAFLMDHGDDTSTSGVHDDQIHKFRTRFEELLGNMTHKSARGPPNSEPPNSGLPNSGLPNPGPSNV
ncbi:hypothetical protein C0995_015188 [Termitomyces sp. Mi166|nr:hypothetical protein C0995_015188 [Termitomyces sp. Mi166\